MTNAKNKNKRKGKYNVTIKKLENHTESEQKSPNKVTTIHAVVKKNTAVNIETVTEDVNTDPKKNESVKNAENPTISLESMDSKPAESNHSLLTATIQVTEANKTEIDTWSEAATRAAATTLRLLELFGHDS